MMKNKRVIYTCITGNYDRIVDPTFIQPDFDYIYFTDNPNQDSKVWQFRPIPDELNNLSKIKQQRAVKICPHKYLSEYDESIYIDGSIDVLCDMNKFLNEYCNDVDKSVFIRKHPLRTCLYNEVNAVVQLKKDTIENIKPQITRYKNEGFPENFGLSENGIIYRKHNDKYCIQLMELWLNEVINGSYRD